MADLPDELRYQMSVVQDFSEAGYPILQSDNYPILGVKLEILVPIEVIKNLPNGHWLKEPAQGMIYARATQIDDSKKPPY